MAERSPISRGAGFSPKGLKVRHLAADKKSNQKKIMKPLLNTDLFVDVETYCDLSIRDVGAYKYTQHPSFRVLMLSYALGEQPVTTIDLEGTFRTLGDEWKRFNDEGGNKTGTELSRFFRLLSTFHIRVRAHNATFERLSFIAEGIDIPLHRWYCDMAHAAHCGLPLGLAQLSKLLKLGKGKAKMAEGKALIRYFSCPCKPTKANEGRTRNLPFHDEDKWDTYLLYNNKDVAAEREIARRLAAYESTAFEQELYMVNETINDRGILIDTDMAKKMCHVRDMFIDGQIYTMKRLTGLANPNSVSQLKGWIYIMTGQEVESLDKAAVSELIKGLKENNSSDNSQLVKKVLKARQMVGKKASMSKYDKMLECACEDNRARGLFQFCGATRTGRWAGRLIQLQNLTKNKSTGGRLDLFRQVAKRGDIDEIEMVFGNVADILSQLVRTALIPTHGKTFSVADYSAIEARVLAWVAGEEWKLDVFRGHGKIYEANASKMFNVPIDEIGHDSPLRAKGKVSELALGYGGGVSALEAMGAAKMGLNEMEMKSIINLWRSANPLIKELWTIFDKAAKSAVKNCAPVDTKKGIVFDCDGRFMTILLPSGRKLMYYKPHFVTNRFGSQSVAYYEENSMKHQICEVETYGGKLTENIIQAISRDLLGYALINLEKRGYPVVMHVHDEAICEVNPEGADEAMAEMCDIMAEKPEWAEGLPLTAAGYVTPYYMKD